MHVGPLQQLAELRRWCTWLPEDKAPRTPHGYAKTNDPNTWGTLNQVSKHGRVGIITGDLGEGRALVALDFDAHKDKPTKTVIRPAYSAEGWARELVPVVDALTDKIGPMPIERSPSGAGAHAFVLLEGVPDGVKHRNVIKIDPFELEVLGGQFCTVTGDWITDAELPRVSWQTFSDALASLNFQAQLDTATRPKVEHPPSTVEDLRDALEAIDPAKLTRDEWRDVGMALKHEGAPCSVWDRWSMRDARYREGDCDRQWASFTGSGITGATIFHLAIEQGWRNKPRVREWTGPELGEATPTPPTPRIWFSSRNDALVVEHILEQHATAEPVVYDQGAYWRWDAPRWEPLPGEQPSDMLAATLHEWQRHERMWLEPTEKKPEGAPYILSSGAQQGIIKQCRIAAQRPNFFDEAAVGVAFSDVFLRVEGRELVTEPITAAHRQRHAYAFEYDPHATCPTTDRYLREILAGHNDADTEDKLRLVRQFWGATILGLGPRYLRALVLLGRKGSGKSTIGDLVCATMPSGSVSTVELQEFGDDKKAIAFATARLNYLAEVKHERPVSNHTVIKTVIGGEYITARDVYRSAVTFKPRAAHLWCANRMPQIPGVDASFWDRMMVLPVDANQYRDTAKQVLGLAGILAAQELPGIVRHALDGARDLLENGRYAVPLSARQALDSWTHQADAVALWLDEATMRQPSDAPVYGWPRPTEVHEHYQMWARSRCHQQMSHHELIERVLSRGVARKNSQGARIGLLLRSSADWSAGEPADAFAPF